MEGSRVQLRPQSSTVAQKLENNHTEKIIREKGLAETSGDRNKEQRPSVSAT